MSFVITPICSSSASARQIVAISELLPTPTGPAMPRRSDRVVSVVSGATSGLRVSGTEQSPFQGGVGLRPLLDLRSAEGGDRLRLGQNGDAGRVRLEVFAGLEGPPHGRGRVERLELQERGRDSL